MQPRFMKGVRSPLLNHQIPVQRFNEGVDLLTGSASLIGVALAATVLDVDDRCVRGTCSTYLIPYRHQQLASPVYGVGYREVLRLNVNNQ